MSGEEPPSHEGAGLTSAGSEQGDRNEPRTSSLDEIIVETIDDDEESTNNDEDNQEDGVLVVEIHDEAPDEVIAVYEEADLGLFDDDDDEEVVASAADNSLRPRAKKRRKKGATTFRNKRKG